MIKINPLASGSSGNCYHITDGSSGLLIEAGVSISKIKEGLNYRLTEVDGCLISHEHGDHSGAINKLWKNGTEVYMTKGTKQELEVENHRINEINIHGHYNIGSWVMRPLKAEHDAAEPVNFLLWSKATGDKLVYLTDTYYTRYKFHELDYIMIECNYAKDILDENVKVGRVPAVQKNRVIQSHFSLENVKEFLKVNDLEAVKEIWLLHLSDDNSDESRFKKEIQKLTGKPVKIA